MAPTFEIRRLMRDDAADYRAIRLEGLERHPEAFGASYEDEAARDLDVFVKRLVDGVVFGGFQAGASQAGASQAGALCGIAGYFVHPGPKERHKATLVGMYVRDAARGAGLAGRLVDRVIADAAGHVELLHLTVNTANPTARRLYERRGFTCFGVDPRSLKVAGRYHDEALMVLDLRIQGK